MAPLADDYTPTPSGSLRIWWLPPCRFKYQLSRWRARSSRPTVSLGSLLPATLAYPVDSRTPDVLGNARSKYVRPFDQEYSAGYEVGDAADQAQTARGHQTQTRQTNLAAAGQT